jgi:hypothetical protein
MLVRYRLWSWEERERQGGGRLKVIILSILHQMLTHTNRRMVMANGKKTHSHCRLAKHCRSALQLHVSILSCLYLKTIIIVLGIEHWARIQNVSGNVHIRGHLYCVVSSGSQPLYHTALYKLSLEEVYS